MDSEPPPGSSEVPESNRKDQEYMDQDLLKENQRKEVNSKEVNPKWVSIAQEKRSLKKYDVEVTSVDGKHKVAIPENLLADATPLWEDFIVGKFLDI